MYTTWMGLVRNPLAEQLARIMEENPRFAAVYDEGPQFHAGIYRALRSPDEAGTITALVDGMADMQRQIQAMLTMAEAYTRSRISAGIAINADDLAKFAARKEEQLLDQMRSPEA